MEIVWKVLQVERLVENGLIIKVTYSCNGKSENFRDRRVGIVELEGDPNSEGFIPYDDLQEEDVLLWVKSSLGDKYSETEDQVKDFIEKQEQEFSSKNTEEGLPWRKSRLEDINLK